MAVARAGASSLVFINPSSSRRLLGNDADATDRHLRARSTRARPRLCPPAATLHLAAFVSPRAHLTALSAPSSFPVTNRIQHSDAAELIYICIRINHFLTSAAVVRSTSHCTMPLPTLDLGLDAVDLVRLAFLGAAGAVRIPQ
jgi:hypothetical protein